MGTLVKSAYSKKYPWERRQWVCWKGEANEGMKSIKGEDELSDLLSNVTSTSDPCEEFKRLWKGLKVILAV